MRPCLRCGEVVDGSYCTEHDPGLSRGRVGNKYDAAWDRLSRRARRLQPWCSDCGTPHDLTADHSAEAWRRKAVGLPLRLIDIDVVCRACNTRRGAPTQGESPHPTVERGISKARSQMGMVLNSREVPS